MKRRWRYFIAYIAMLALFLVFCDVEDPLDRNKIDPVMTSSFAIDTLYLYSDTTITLTATIEDVRDFDRIAKVFASWYRASVGAPFRIDTLKDDGKGADIIPKNGTYTKGIQTNFLRSEADSVVLLLLAEGKDGSGYMIGQYTLKLLLAFRGDTTEVKNTPPELFDLQAPSSVNRNMEEPILLTVAVRDSQGLSDIHSVYFNTYKPNGSPSSNNPFYMYDNGALEEYGDESASDGIYSRIIKITAAADTGNYRFEFFARDFSDSLSQPLIHIMKVYDEIN